MTGEKQVNLFIVGAMKAGTTSFVELLRQHPELYIPPIKEPHFFVEDLPKFVYHPSRFFDLDDYFRKDFPAPLHIAHLKSAAQYARLYSLANEQKYLVDASTAYLAASDAAAKIAAYNDKAKIIILLRNPIDRMYSHYSMSVGLGLEKRSFEAVVSSELEAYHAESLSTFSYLGLGLYRQQVDAYKHRFKEVLVLRFEDLTQNTPMLLEDVAKFLEINSFATSSLPHMNETRRLKGNLVFYYFKQLGLKDMFSRFVGKKIRHRIFRMVSSSEKQEMRLSGELERQLNAIFEKESYL